MEKFEYSIIPIDFSFTDADKVSKAEAILNSWGRTGWEVTRYENGFVILKKKIKIEADKGLLKG